MPAMTAIELQNIVEAMLPSTGQQYINAIRLREVLLAFINSFALLGSASGGVNLTTVMRLIGEAGHQSADDVTAAIASTLNNSPVLGNDPTSPTADEGDDDGSVSNTEFVTRAIRNAFSNSPALGNNPTTPTPDEGDNDDSVSNTEFVTRAVASAIANSPALGNDPTTPTADEGDNDNSVANTEFVTRAIATLMGGVILSIATERGLEGGGNSGVITLGIEDSGVTYAMLSNAAIAGLRNGLAELMSPEFLGIPLSTTAPAGNNSTRIATTAFVASAITAAILSGGADGVLMNAELLPDGVTLRLNLTVGQPIDVNLMTLVSGLISQINAGNGLLGGGSSGEVELRVNPAVVAVLAGAAFVGPVSGEEPVLPGEFSTKRYTDAKITDDALDTDTPANESTEQAASRRSVTQAIANQGGGFNIHGIADAEVPEGADRLPFSNEGTANDPNAYITWEDAVGIIRNVFIYTNSRPQAEEAHRHEVGISAHDLSMDLCIDIPHRTTESAGDWDAIVPGNIIEYFYSEEQVENPVRDRYYYTHLRDDFWSGIDVGGGRIELIQDVADDALASFLTDLGHTVVWLHGHPDDAEALQLIPALVVDHEYFYWNETDQEIRKLDISTFVAAGSTIPHWLWVSLIPDPPEPVVPATELRQFTISTANIDTSTLGVFALTTGYDLTSYNDGDAFIFEPFGGNPNGAFGINVDGIGLRPTRLISGNGNVDPPVDFMFSGGLRRPLFRVTYNSPLGIFGVLPLMVGSMATRTHGTAEGEFPSLEADGQFDEALIPDVETYLIDDFPDNIAGIPAADKRKIWRLTEGTSLEHIGFIKHVHPNVARLSVVQNVDNQGHRGFRILDDGLQGLLRPAMNISVLEEVSIGTGARHRFNIEVLDEAGIPYTTHNFISIYFRPWDTDQRWHVHGLTHTSDGHYTGSEFNVFNNTYQLNFEDYELMVRSMGAGGDDGGLVDDPPAANRFEFYPNGEKAVRVIDQDDLEHQAVHLDFVVSNMNSRLAIRRDGVAVSNAPDYVNLSDAFTAEITDDGGVDVGVVAGDSGTPAALGGETHWYYGIGQAERWPADFPNTDDPPAGAGLVLRLRVAANGPHQTYRGGDEIDNMFVATGDVSALIDAGAPAIDGQMVFQPPAGVWDIEGWVGFGINEFQSAFLLREITPVIDDILLGKGNDYTVGYTEGTIDTSTTSVIRYPDFETDGSKSLYWAMQDMNPEDTLKFVFRIVKRG